MQKEGVMTALDEIQTRADRAQFCWESYQGGGDADDEIIDINESAADVPALLAALRLVKSLAAQWHREYKDLDTRWVTDDAALIRCDGRDDAAHEIDVAIREALG